MRQAASAWPEKVAVRSREGTLTYSELSERADQVAHALRRLGVRPGSLVGQCVERSAGLVVSALGIARAGCAYVAIDPEYPDARVEWMLADSGAGALVTDEPTADRLTPSADRPNVVLATGGKLRDPFPALEDRDPPAQPGPTDLAYVVYTSGSSGRPKGVLIEHGSLANLVAWHHNAFGLGPEDRCTQIASPGFDAAVWEIWPSLASGAAIHIVPAELRADPIGLRDWLTAEEITVTFLPTAVAEGVIGLPWPAEARLRYLLTGGDALGRRPPSGLGFTVVNNYGPSEATVVSTSGPVAPEGHGAPSIGRAIEGAVLEIVDEALSPVEPGADGELLVGGVGVARGYVNRPELTAERFVDRPSGRMYRTGDRVRQAPTGEVEFLGRLDDQLSVRGFRVEPGEIVAALGSHPAIEASVPVVSGQTSAEKQLVAYVVAAGDERPDRDELARFLGGFLPEHMVPSRYVWLDRLPLTAHGKIDRDALPDAFEASRPEAPLSSGTAEDAISPGETSVEDVTASVVAELLEIESVGHNENFFLLGGHSMLGAQLIVRLEELFGVEVSLRFLFDHPTAAEIAAEVERQLASDRAEGAVPS